MSKRPASEDNSIQKEPKKLSFSTTEENTKASKSNNLFGYIHTFSEAKKLNPEDKQFDFAKSDNLQPISSIDVEKNGIKTLESLINKLHVQCNDYLKNGHNDSFREAISKIEQMEEKKSRI
jgi:hypothetical protein